MKIAILHCRKSDDVCTGAACFKAYNTCQKHFAQYTDAQPELAAFFDCGGCDCDRANDAGMNEKLARLKSEGVSKVHIGVCALHCPRLSELKAMLARYDLPFEEGTH